MWQGVEEAGGGAGGVMRSDPPNPTLGQEQESWGPRPMSPGHTDKEPLFAQGILRLQLTTYQAWL